MAARAVLTSRRSLLTAAGAVAAAAGIAACTRTEGDAAAATDVGLADGPGVWAAGSQAGPTQFGILISSPPHRSAEEFERDLEALIDLGMTWVRIAVVADTVVDTWGFAAGQVQLKQDVLELIASAAARAHELGLKVCMVVADIYDAPDADEDEFLRNMRQYWAGVVRPLAPHVDMWQIFNEPDGAHYRTLKGVPDRQRPDYLRELARSLAAAHEVLEQIDPGMTMTTNLYGYPLGDAMERRWEESLDVLAPHLDLLTVDAYPELSETETRELPHRIERLSDRYGKEVVVGEMGLQTCSHCATEQDQATAYGMYLDVLRSSSIPVIFFYELRDDGTDTGEGTFGIEDVDGREKPAYAVIRDHLGS